MKDLLVLDDLCKSFPIDLLNPVSFSLKNISASFSKGSCSAFLGHNGAGKTSTIKIILGLLKADQGRVLFKGQEMSRQDRALLGYMPETSRLSMEMTPWEHVRMQLGLYSAYSKDLSLKQRDVLAQEHLKLVRLWDHRHKKTQFLSKGMRRRIAWAQAYAHSPEVLILDEPFEGLDPVGRRELLLWLKELRSKGVTLLISSHELDAIMELADQILVMKDGQLAYQENRGSGKQFHFVVDGSDFEGLKAKAQEDSINLPESLRVTEDNKLEMFFSDSTLCQKFMNFCFLRGFTVSLFREQSGSFDLGKIYQLFH